MIIAYVDTESIGTPILYGHDVFLKREMRTRNDTWPQFCIHPKASSHRHFVDDGGSSCL